MKINGERIAETVGVLGFLLAAYGVFLQRDRLPLPVLQDVPSQVVLDSTTMIPGLVSNRGLDPLGITSTVARLDLGRGVVLYDTVRSGRFSERSFVLEPQDSEPFTAEFATDGVNADWPVLPDADGMTREAELRLFVRGPRGEFEIAERLLVAYAVGTGVEGIWNFAPFTELGATRAWVDDQGPVRW